MTKRKPKLSKEERRKYEETRNERWRHCALNGSLHYTQHVFRDIQNLPTAPPTAKRLARLMELWMGKLIRAMKWPRKESEGPPKNST